MAADLRMVKQSSEPLIPKRPHEDTVEVMEELRSGGGKRFGSVAELLDDMNVDDQTA